MLEKTIKQLINGMTKMKNLILIISVFLCGSTSHADVGVPSSDRMIEISNNIIVGEINKDSNHEYYITVEKSLKGDLVANSKILIDPESQIAWTIRFGPIQPTKEQFDSALSTSGLIGQRILLLGEFRQGRWISSKFDWAIWPKGYNEFKGKSVDDLIKIIIKQLSSLP
jgi:hypothetical protein